MQNRPVWFFRFGDRGHSARRRRHVAGGCLGAAIQIPRKCPTQHGARNAQEAVRQNAEQSGQHARAPLFGETRRATRSALAALFALVQTDLLCAGSDADLLRRVKRKSSQSLSLRRVSIFRWINRPPARA